jgi:hypothetical protein
MPVAVGAALLASAEGYTPRANKLLEDARERLGTIHEIAGALADDLPAPKTGPSRSRRRRRRKKKGPATGAPEAQAAEAPAAEGDSGGEKTPPAEVVEAAPKPKRRRRRKPAADGDGEALLEAPTETDAAA